MQMIEMNNLNQSCADGNLGNLEVLNGVDINSCNEDNLTALQTASAQGQENVVSFLLSKGASPDQGTDFSPLMHAARYGHTSILSKLIQHNANVNIKNKLGTTALMAAVRSGHLSSVRCLLNAGARVNHSNAEIQPLMIASQYGFDSIVKMLIDNGAEVNLKSTSANLTALMYATLNGHKRTAQILVEHGADVDLMNVCEKTALDIAVIRGKRVIKGYLDQKTNIKFRWKANVEENIFDAIKKSDLKLVGELLNEYEYLKNILRDEDKISPLMYAVIIGNLDVVKLIINSGADINLKDGENGWTALLHAVARGKNNILKYLLESNADVNVTAFNGCTAFYLACIVDDIETNLIRELAAKTLFNKIDYLSLELENLETPNLKDWRNRLHNRFRAFKFGRPFRLFPTSQSTCSLQSENENVQTSRAKSAYSRRERSNPIIKWKSEENLPHNDFFVSSPIPPIDVPSAIFLSDNVECVIPPLAFDASFSYRKTEMPPGKKNSFKINEDFIPSRIIHQCTTSKKNVVNLNQIDKAINSSKPEQSNKDKLHSILDQYSLLRFESLFNEEEIDFEAFLCLTEDDLKELGILDESRMLMLNVIRELKFRYDYYC